MAWQTFATVAGHRAQLDVLKRICGSEHPAHAYLFEGPSGVGKQTVAWALGARLACLNAEGKGDACGDCRSCHALQRGEHPDIALLSRDGAQIKIGQVRDALKRLRYEPVLGRAKVLIIEDAERLREEAANALLKTLEEPAPNTHFILVTSASQLLLDTIRSRTQVLRFSPLSPADVRALLANEGIEEERAAIAAALSQGDLSRARKLSDPELLAAVDDVVRFALNLDTAPGTFAAAFVDGLIEQLAAIDGSRGMRVTLDRERLRWTLDVLRAVFRDVMLAAAGVNVEDLPHARYAESIMAMAERVRAREVADVITALDRLEDDLAYNPNPRVALEAQLVSAAATLRGAS